MSIQEKIKAFAPHLEKMPGVTVIHEIDGFKPLFMTSNGLKLLGLNMEELINIGEDYQRLFFNSDFMPDFLSKLFVMMKKNSVEDAYTFLHQVEINGRFEWYLASIKEFHRDPSNHPTHTITTAFSVDDYEWTRKRGERLLTEQRFFDKHSGKFKSLSGRETEVLKNVALGKSTSKIAEELNISQHTVNSHRKNLKQKLGISSSYEFTEYAFSFDLI